VVEFRVDLGSSVLGEARVGVITMEAWQFFKTFTKNEVCDTVKKAVAAGGAHAVEPMDHGFMYGWSFYDLDRHHWEVLWMDPAAIGQ
jgi:predicted lactoylglutathione lyase